jgi:hypothetical protein
LILIETNRDKLEKNKIKLFHDKIWEERGEIGWEVRDWGMKEDGSTRLGERKRRSVREERDWGGKDETGEGRVQGSLSPNFFTSKAPRNRFQGINSTSLCSLAGRYDNPVPSRFLAPIECLIIPTLSTGKAILRQSTRVYLSEG